MSSWSVSAEFFAFVILCILMVSFFDKGKLSPERGEFFLICIIFPLFYCALNVISVITVRSGTAVPLWANLVMKSFFYFMGPVLACAQALYLMEQLLTYVYDKSYLHRAAVLTAGMAGAHFLLILWNLRSGVIFYFDENQGYHHGPLYQIGYLIILVEVVLITVCYFQNRRSINPAAARTLYMLPPIVAAVVIYQFMYPRLLVNGALFAVSDLVLFLGLQGHRADLDSLTEIGNRNCLFTELTLRMRGRQHFQLILVSLWQFSSVNQLFDHSGGDAFLQEIARELNHLFPSGKAFRFGSVKFAVLLPFENAQGARENLETIRARFSQLWSAGSWEIPLEARFADLVYSGQDWQPTQVMEYLEYTLTLTKNSGLDAARFNEQTAAMLKKRKELIWTLRRSIQERRFRVWYQPVYSCGTASFSSAEALLRLEDYRGKAISPAEFIPLAEETGLIDDLSWIVLDEVCRFLSEGRAPGLEAVSINLSMQQFKDPCMIRHIEETLKHYGVAPCRLKLEITERVLLQDLAHMCKMMSALSAHGLHFYLDDFGTGYSNLSSVLALPFECIKLDQSLLVHFPEDSRANLLVRTLVDLFHEMGQQVVAEGVELPEQAEALKAFQTDWLQGYYYARPMPESGLVAFLKNH